MPIRISIEFPSQQDFQLIQLLLNRLGVPYRWEESPQRAGEHWLSGLGLVQEPVPQSFEAHLADKWEPGTRQDMPAYAVPYGAWESEGENLEDLLGMLTP